MKILYGLPSEGMGHATRSNVILSYLAKNHDVRIVTSDRAFSFMKERFPGRVYEIKGFHLAYKNGSISKYETAAMLIKNGPKDLIENINKFFLLLKEFEPDLVITDFDPFTFFFASLNKHPLISIDNIQVMTRCKLEIQIPQSEKNNFLLAKNITRAIVPNASCFLITSFFNVTPNKKNTSVVPSILREKILNAKTESREHFIVYQTSSSQNNLIEILNRIPKIKFLVYGFNRDEEYGNVILKKFSEDGFIDDLASARGVISNGGFSLLSEAVYLKKPVCSVPIKGQFEQFINAAYIEKSGYGRHFNEFTADSIKSFLFDMEIFQNNLSQYYQNGNHETFSKLEEIMYKLA